MNNLQNLLTFVALFIFIFSVSCVCNRLFNFICPKSFEDTNQIQNQNPSITIEEDEAPPKYEEIDRETDNLIIRDE